MRLLRNQGMERRYANEIVGFNLRMTDLHAAIGRVQLGRLPGWTGDRRRNAARLSAGLAEPAAAGGLALPRVAAAAQPVWHQYTVRAPDRDRLIASARPAGRRQLACSTRRRSTGCRPYGLDLSTCRRPSGPRPRCCRCRCTRR